MTERINSLEGLRGFAALIVTTCHPLSLMLPALFLGDVSISHFGNAEIIARWSPLNLIWNGNAAVCIFFVLSGYVLSYKYFQTKDMGVAVEGILRRYPRLTPLILVSTIIAYVLLSNGCYYLSQASVIGDPTNVCRYYDRYDFTSSLKDAVSQGIYGTILFGRANYNGPMWTMTYEFIGSMYILAFVILFGKTKYRPLFYALALLIFHNSFYFAFFLGALLCDIESNMNVIRGKIDSWVTFPILLTGLVFLSYKNVGNYADPIHNVIQSIMSFQDYQSFIQIIGAAMFIFALLYTNSLKKIFGSPVGVFLGKISFSMYAFHWVVMSSLTSIMFLYLYPLFPYWLTVPIVLSVSVIATIAIATVFYHLVDAPGVVLSKKVSKKVFDLVFKHHSRSHDKNSGNIRL